MSSWPRFIRDPIHGLIRFDDAPLDRLLLDLIDCCEFQRLRRIRQLGFADFVFPGATHTRFAHSIGVMWNAKRFLDRLRVVQPELVGEPDDTVIVTAALLHDLGHGPFSHAFEKVTQRPHEYRTAEVILDPSTEIHRALGKHKAVSDLPCRVASLFPEAISLVQSRCGQIKESPPILTQIVSSQCDADRADYLVRDSHSCGTGYGRFDLDWLLAHMHAEPDKNRLYFSPKARQSVEDYIFARYHMYQSVYFHKAIRSAEVMLKLLFERFRQLAARTPGKPAQIVPDAPESLVNALGGGTSLKEFLSLDDHSVTTFAKACATGGDATLRYLASGLLNRRLYKCVDATDAARERPVEFGKFSQRVAEALSGMGDKLPVEREFAFVSDTPADTPYKIYDPDAANPATQLYLRSNTGEVSDLSTTSDVVDSLRRKITQLRYYFPVEARCTIEPLATELLGKGA